MNETHDVISAFLDGEPFDPDDLTAALADASGRALLIDLIGLRHVVRADVSAPVASKRVQRRWVSGVVVAAALVLTLLGGYRIGEWRAAAAATTPPAPTLIVPANTSWQ
jgi:hypothetical protein